MKWLSNVIAAIIDAVVEVIDQVLTAAVEFLTDLLEIIGHGLGAFFNWLADAYENIPGNFRPGSAGGLRWIGNMLDKACETLAVILKASVSLLIDMLTGALRILGGILSLNGGLILKGLDDIVSGLVGAVVIIAGKILEILQTASSFQGGGRPLTKAERDLLRRIYRNSLSLGVIRINDNSAGAFNLSPDPFVLGNTIFLKGKNVNPDDPNGEPEILVHESVHVWQYQHEGSGYVGRALGNTYDASNRNGGFLAEVAAGRLRWTDFHKEAQAWFVEDIYTRGELLTPNGLTTDVVTGNGAFFDANGSTSHGRFEWLNVDHTGLANDAVEAIRRRISFRLSQWL